MEGFYISVIDGKRTALIAGPFGVHEQAIYWVPWFRRWCEEDYPRTVFAAFGTVKITADNLPKARYGLNVFEALLH